jgi:hypothetical protein
MISATTTCHHLPCYSAPTSPNVHMHACLLCPSSSAYSQRYIRLHHRRRRSQCAGSDESRADFGYTIAAVAGGVHFPAAAGARSSAVDGSYQPNRCSFRILAAAATRLMRGCVAFFTCGVLPVDSADIERIPRAGIGVVVGGVVVVVVVVGAGRYALGSVEAAAVVVVVVVELAVVLEAAVVAALFSVVRLVAAVVLVELALSCRFGSVGASAEPWPSTST